MKKSAHQDEIKSIKLLQDRSSKIAELHSSIGLDIDLIKGQLAVLGASEISQSHELFEKKDDYLHVMSCERPLNKTDLKDIYQEAASCYQEPMALNEILTDNDFKNVNDKLDRRILDFNARYGLDKWDYAIAGACGLFAAMLDLLCVKAPLKPTVKWNQDIDGIFNKWVQKAFNKALSTDISDILSKKNVIGAPDSSVATDLIGAPAKVIAPINHRLRSLAHDPVFGFLFGAWDMMHGTCTVVTNGVIRSFPSTKANVSGSIFQLLGRMFGHLMSDVNAQSGNKNRGMGLPAPFMSILRMLEGIPVGNTNFGKQIEWMYVNGYDFRQFVTSSISMVIMEVLLRSFYTIKQVKLYGTPFGESMLDTMPIKMNPKFRIILALSYGTNSAVNAGVMCVTNSILHANYSSWMGLSWNGFHALKWALLDRQLELWGGIEAKEIEEIENLIGCLDCLSVKVSRLPI